MTAGVLLTLLSACGDSSPLLTKLLNPVRYEVVAPPDGTALRRGDPVEVQVRVVDGPEPLGMTLLMAVEFVHPDGRPDNSFLPGVEQANGVSPFPVTLTVRFVVPVGTPEGNIFIPPGSRVTALRVNLSCRVGTLSQGPGIVATYPVID
jgi:hypothetical protein